MNDRVLRALAKQDKIIDDLRRVPNIWAKLNVIYADGINSEKLRELAEEIGADPVEVLNLTVNSSFRRL